MSNYKYWLEKIDIDSLPNDDLKIVAEVLGLNAAITMIQELNGTSIFIPRDAAEKATRKLREQYVMNHYDGTRICRRRLANFCLFSDTAIYRIVRKRNII